MGIHLRVIFKDSLSGQVDSLLCHVHVIQVASISTLRVSPELTPVYDL